jgi:hypothetical protein
VGEGASLKYVTDVGIPARNGLSNVERTFGVEASISDDDVWRACEDGNGIVTDAN